MSLIGIKLGYSQEFCNKLPYATFLFLSAAQADTPGILMLSPFYGLPPPIMTISPQRDGGFGPFQADAADQAAYMRPHFDPVGGFARPQDRHHAVPAVSVVDVQRHEAAFIMKGIEQRQLLMAMHRVGCVVDIQGDVRGWALVAVTPPIDHRVGEADQRSQIGRVLAPRLGWLRGEGQAGVG